MNALEVIREKWLTERPRYEILVTAATRILEVTLREKSINIVAVSGRVKELPSLLKKVLRNAGTDDPYGSMTDKAGVRAVVLFERDIEMANEAIRGAFVVLKRDDKRELLGRDRLGYASVHF
ncbi:MAG TPA: RelA/SpoT domain-containing protein, partial [Firmicutes bacterium]|nr:RelA/SpoT domain-containing protein [Bacillota bacterium]